MARALLRSRRPQGETISIPCGERHPTNGQRRSIKSAQSFAGSEVTSLSGVRASSRGHGFGLQRPFPAVSSGSSWDEHRESSEEAAWQEQKAQVTEGTEAGEVGSRRRPSRAASTRTSSCPRVQALRATSSGARSKRGEEGHLRMCSPPEGRSGVKGQRQEGRQGQEIQTRPSKRKRKRQRQKEAARRPESCAATESQISGAAPAAEEPAADPPDLPGLVPVTESEIEILGLSEDSWETDESASIGRIKADSDDDSFGRSADDSDCSSVGPKVRRSRPRQNPEEEAWEKLDDWRSTLHENF